MSQGRPPSGARRIGAVSTAITLTLLLAACAPGSDAAAPSNSPSSTASPSAVPTPSSTSYSDSDPSPTSTAGTPVEASCLDLVSLATMYEFDPNFGLSDDYSPAAGTVGATAEAASGIVCGWVQQTSGEVIEITAAQPSTDELARLRAEAGSDEAFATLAGRGVVQVFRGPFWVTASSSYFGSGADADPLVSSALAALD